MNKKKTFFEKSTPYETVTNAMKSTQNLSPRRFWHAGHEFDVKNLPISHPDLEMKENDLYFFLKSVQRVFSGLPTVGFGWELEEMNPTDLPELSKPKFPRSNRGKAKI